MSPTYAVTKSMADADLVTIGCTRGEWAAASRGFLGAVATVLDDDKVAPEPGGRLPAAWLKEYERRVVTYNTAERPTLVGASPYAQMNYDALWMWAYALDKMAKGTATTSAFPVSKLSFPAVAEQDVAATLKTHLIGTSFDGASGRVTIDSKTQDRGGIAFVVSQSTSTRGGKREVASYSLGSRAFTAIGTRDAGSTALNITWPTADGSKPSGFETFGFAVHVTAIEPAYIQPEGAEIFITGSGFLGELALSVGVGGAECKYVKLLDSSGTQLSCLAPEGTRENVPVVVEVDGVKSPQGPSVTYRPATVLSMSTDTDVGFGVGWSVSGDDVVVYGLGFSNTSQV
jgi:hypothetical protein